MRAAIMEANAGPQFLNPYTITFSVNGTINLASELPVLQNRIAINGPGQSNLTVRRNVVAPFRILTVDPNNVVAIRDLTISNGSTPAGSLDANSGGGIGAHPGFLWVIFSEEPPMAHRFGVENHGVSRSSGGYKSRPPQ
ncbi:MAG TPA: hypothetical protein VFE62_03780 [Gemmataceae bacterium]|nr:hypothetical protein [Gemmataceae bacterium]